MYKESYEIMLRRYELDRDELVLKKHRLILKSNYNIEYDQQIAVIDGQIVEDEKCIAWVTEQIKQGKIRPDA